MFGINVIVALCLQMNQLMLFNNSGRCHSGKFYHKNNNNMQIVGFGTRVLNFLVDLIFVFSIAYLLNKVWDWYVVFYEYTPYSFGEIFGLVVFVYYFLFEWIFARTPGKWFSRSKVVTQSGGKPGIWPVFVRSIIRLTIIDAFFIPFLEMPLHDYLSKTRVVEA